jgi:cell division protein FtsQ
MHVRATQRKPIARLHSSADIEDIYIDSNGESLALSPYFTARVPVIHATSIEAAQPAISFIETIRHDQFWWAFCDQLTVKADGKLEVIPRIGNARIAFDSNENLERQLDKLFTFYHEQIRRGSLNDYKRIDLSFHEQVVAQRYY